MRTLLVSAFLSLFFTAQASAEVSFKGAIQWVKATNCSGELTGLEYGARFHPRIAGNSDFASITTIFTYDAFLYKLNGKNFTTAFQTVIGKGISGDAYTPSPAPQVLVSSQTPATISLTTLTVTLRGQIKSPWGDPGVGGNRCIVDFEAVFFKDRPISL